MGKQKLAYLEKFGSLVQKEINKAFFVFPMYLKRDNRLKNFREFTETFCKS